jgi:hypothetical protein
LIHARSFGSHEGWGVRVRNQKPKLRSGDG